MYRFEPVEKVDKHLVHKEHDDDILIINGRNAIPVYVDDSLLEPPLVDGLAIDQLRRYYIPCPVVPGRYVLRGVLPFISLSKKQFDEIDSECLELLGKHYEKTNDGYVLKSQYINEIEESILARAFSDLADTVEESDRLSISRILQSACEATRPMVYYASMFNDTKNYFFYRKHHEHVPGIMLMEVARQAMYAHFYQCRAHRREDITLSIDSFRMAYLNFTESNYPVRIMVEDISPAADADDTTKDERSIQRGGSRATFYQRNKPVATAEISATLVKVNLFKRLRRCTTDKSHRFFPIKNFSKLVLVTSRTGKKFEAQVVNLSLAGLRLSFPKGTELAEGEIFDVSFYVDSVGYVNSTNTLVWQADCQGCLEAGFSIFQIETLFLGRLKEVIKNFTFVDHKRTPV
ncbi:AfsA-related hotdog domain-containing protein [Aquabacterium sp.]|uniref:AfsA-related hotdog domain-containing protein n=1 Tax=Aquabacterium sp. TaxID=1872578 RepID=UPI004037798B